MTFMTIVIRERNVIKKYIDGASKKCNRTVHETPTRVSVLQRMTRDCQITALKEPFSITRLHLEIFFSRKQRTDVQFSIFIICKIK